MGASQFCPPKCDSCCLFKTESEKGSQMERLRKSSNRNIFHTQSGGHGGHPQQQASAFCDVYACPDLFPCHRAVVVCSPAVIDAVLLCPSKMSLQEQGEITDAGRLKPRSQADGPITVEDWHRCLRKGDVQSSLPHSVARAASERPILSE